MEPSTASDAKCSPPLDQATHVTGPWCARRTHLTADVGALRGGVTDRTKGARFPAARLSAPIVSNRSLTSVASSSAQVTVPFHRHWNNAVGNWRKKCRSLLTIDVMSPTAVTRR